MSSDPAVTTRGRWRWALVGVGLLASHATFGVLGYGVGGIVGVSRAAEATRNNPRAQIYLRLYGTDGRSGEPAARVTLEKDIATIEPELVPPTGQILRLMADLKGVGTQGVPDMAQAAARCQAMGWSRCDAVALERMIEELE